MAAAIERLLPRRSYNVVRIAVAGGLADAAAPGGLRVPGRGRGGASLLTLLATLRAVRTDPNVGIVLLDVADLGAGWARLQTLRDAISAVRAAGVPVWSYLPQPGMREWYLAAATDRVFLAPGAVFDATGIASELVFVKGALDRLGVEAQVARVGRFKSAAETFTRREMSDENRVMVNTLLDDLYDQLVADTARDRHLAPEAVRDAFAVGPLLARDALARGLVDRLAYPDEVEEELEARFGDPAIMDLPRYLRRRRTAIRRAALDAPVVGLLGVDGAIQVGDAASAGSSNRMGNWRAFRRELGRMAHDADLAAIVLRVDSPGGSALASDLMWREIVQARALKPVVVSMGDVAASGGYYLAAAADHVTAEPGTLTGSIGVLAAKPVVRGLYEHLGIAKELVVRGNAARHSDWVRLDETDLARLQEEADSYYDDFVGKVASGRSLPRDRISAVAEGRVWTGRQAEAHGLVDGLGGLEATLADLRTRLGLGPDAPIVLDRRPRLRPLQQLVQRVRPFAGLTDGMLDLLAPLAVGERVLAAMPVLFRFLPAARSSPASDAMAMLTASAPGPFDVAGTLRALVRTCARPFRPPLVL